MKYDEALTHALKVLKERPNYILGGSLALMVQDAISRREVGDFDFVINVPNLKEVTVPLDLSTNYGIEDHGGYKRVKIVGDRSFTGRFGDACYYDLFYREQTQVIAIEVDNQKINVQLASEILEYKVAWGRYVDEVDLGTFDMDGIPF